ncbi:NAD-dependent DNA ligase N-terminal domain-containing protein [Cohnella lubricantis]
MTEPLKRMQELVATLNDHSRRYYTEDNPTISDKEYDLLYDELVALEAQTGETLPDSPTRRVGGDILKGFEPHRHLARLWSLDKAQSTEDLAAWETRVRKLIADYNAKNPERPLPEPEFVVELKYDGLTLNLTYEGGELAQAATRGNGVLSVKNELYKKAQGKLTKTLKYAIL